MSDELDPIWAKDPTTEQAEAIRRTKEAAKAFHDIVAALPQGRERSLALTNIDQGVMWATKACLRSAPAKASGTATTVKVEAQVDALLDKARERGA